MANTVDWAGITERFAKEAQSGGGGQAQAPAESTPISRALGRVSQTDTGMMSQLAGFLTQSANGQYSSQQAMLGQARDQQIAEMQKAYADAIEAGEISVRDAQRAFEENSGVINQNAYVDAERTNVMAEERGLSNSAQMMGMVASDNQRKAGLINQNMTERDRRVADVKDRITSLTTKRDLDISSANASYNYGIANQRGQIASQLSQQMFGMGYDDYNRRQSQKDQINMLGLQDEFQLGQMAQGQKYNLQNMGVQNGYQLQQMAQQQGYNVQNAKTQQGYDLQKMSVDQQNTLKQMAKAFDYDIAKMSEAQIYQLATMAQSYGYDMGLQGSAQNFQAGQNALDRNFQAGQSELDRGFKMQQFQMEQQALSDNYAVELQRELASYKQGTPEYELRKAQLDSSYKAVQLESQAKLMSDVMGKAFADHVGNPPKNPGKGASKKQVESYNKQVDAYNSKMNSFMSDPTNTQTFMSNLEQMEYKEKQKSATNPFNDLLKGMFGGGSKGLDDFLNGSTP